MLRIHDVPVGVRKWGDALLLRVRIDGEYHTGAFISFLGVCEWVRYHRDVLLAKQMLDRTDETISEMVERVEEYLEAA
jgi:hypothetical protein